MGCQDGFRRCLLRFQKQQSQGKSLIAKDLLYRAGGQQVGQCAKGSQAARVASTELPGRLCMDDDDFACIFRVIRWHETTKNSWRLHACSALSSESVSHIPANTS